jgi:post-segregation antitoxin (ccd killing protein)
MRGRAVQLRMMKVAREKARAAAAEVYQQCREGWEEENREAVKEGGRGLTQEVVNG